ncbi:MAG: amino acid ABC transporter ATP-binding protein [Muribaculaceae bacterium]|nr:amino acid ABC transporter ATP-binding protein [Muribaculaceae bacterium]
MIEVSRITKSFNGKTILSEVSLNIAEREMACIIGPIGCGKSTLLRCIAGLEKPESGQINLHMSQDSKSHNHVGMVFQRFNLFPHLTVLHNLTLAPIQVLKMSKSEAEEIALRQLDAVGLRQKADALPSQLSTGQQQRVAIARSLVMNPKILLLDEPLSALDPIAASEVMDVLRKLKKEMTLVMVSHDMNAVEELADKVYFLCDGHIVEYGTAQEIFHNPQKTQTRQFIEHLKSLIYTIDSPQFDRPELNARIEHYCNRFGLGGQAHRFLQLAVEELLNLIPLDGGVDLKLSKCDNEVRMRIDATLPDKGVDYLNEDVAVDVISFSLLNGLCDLMTETSEGGLHKIHLELDQERLLLK